MYKEAVDNKEFLKDIFDGDGDVKPSIFTDDITKTFFTSTYYGWLIGNGTFNKDNYK